MELFYLVYNYAKNSINICKALILTNHTKQKQKKIA